MIPDRADGVVHRPMSVVYGTRLPGRDSFGRALYAARAPAERARDRATWRFWDGSAWVADQTRAAEVLPARGGVSQTLSVDVVNDSIGLRPGT